MTLHTNTPVNKINKLRHCFPQLSSPFRVVQISNNDAFLQAPDITLFVFNWPLPFCVRMASSVHLPSHDRQVRSYRWIHDSILRCQRLLWRDMERSHKPPRLHPEHGFHCCKTQSSGIVGPTLTWRRYGFLQLSETLLHPPQMGLATTGIGRRIFMP